MQAQNLQHCSNARQLLAQVAPTLQKHAGSRNSLQAATEIANEYAKKNLGLNQASLGAATSDQQLGYMRQSLGDCVQQLNAVNESASGPAAAAGGHDFLSMVAVNQCVVKVQAKFRQRLAMKRLEKDIDVQKQKLQKKNDASKGISNEELALKEFKQRLAKKGLTPEAFFRTCDPGYKKSVPVDRFRSMLANFNLELSKGQISRLVLILDEDMEGNITLEEFQNGLEAYNCSGEAHVHPDGSEAYVSFEHRAVFKLLGILKEMNISYQELFRSCDVNNDKDVNLRELETVLSGLSAEFYQKDTQAVHAFLDIDKNNQCTEQEFTSQLTYGERLLAQYKDRLAGVKSVNGGFSDRNDGMDEYIPGFSQASPRTQGERLTSFLANQLGQKNLQPARIFAMADTQRSNSVKFSLILDTLNKILPNLTREFMDQIPYAFEMSPSDMLSKDEFDMLFDTKSNSNTGPQPSALKVKNQRDAMANNSADYTAIIKYFAECLQKENITPLRFFKKADRNFNQVLTVDELKDQVKISLPQSFAGLNFKKLTKALDQNNNGLVEQSEFVGLLDQALSSGADTSQFRRIAGALAGQKDTKANVNSLTLADTVRPQDRLDAQQVIAYLKELLLCEHRVQDPIDDIQAIFDKIQKWKEQAGDLDQQEKMVAKRLQPTEALKIHNIKTAMAKMGELKREIGLTDDEISVILYTSLDQDWMTNLILLQGEFLKWFNLNFEGESREELDFMESKQDIWLSTTTLAMEIVAATDKLTSDQQIILTTKWWEVQRYWHFGTSMAAKFNSEPQLKEQFRALFKAQNDRVSYYDFFQFIGQKLAIKLENWEEDAIESRLDRLGMAFIEFNEFNEFSQEYGLDWGEAVADNDLEDQLEAKNNLSYKDYVLGPSDYFQGCQTMLTSEKAALAKVREMYKELKRSHTRIFTDVDFGPKDQTDQRGSRMSLYKDGTVPQKGYAEPDEVEWVFIEEIAKQPTQFVDDGAAAADCVQGGLGDCWLISAMSVLVTRDELLVGGRRGMEYDPKMIVDKEIATLLSNGVYPPIFHRYRSRGLFVLRIFKNFNWIYVIIDERIPVNITTRKPVFGSCVNPHEMWVALIEKAYAKLHGCYGNLISGYIDEGVQELTGFQPEKVLIRNEKTGCFPHKMIEQHYGGKDGFWAFLLERKQDNCLLGCSIKGYGKEGAQVSDGHPTGLILNHAYSILGVMQIEDPSDKKKPLRLLVLRNPWGKGEWTGAWGSGSPEMTKYTPLLEQYIHSLPPDEQFDLEADDGIFFMHYSDWKEYYSTLFLNLDFPDAWTGVRFKSAWTPSNSGGLPHSYVSEQLERYAKNPQFLIQPVNDTEIMFSLAQTGGRLPVNGRYFEYPFAETLKYCNVAVFKLQRGQRILDAFDKNAITYLSPIKRERENSGRCQLKAGQAYVVVCSTEMNGHLGQFHLSMYMDQSLRDVEIKRVFPAGDKNEAKDEVLPQFIPEESEKISATAPTWKLELVRESLKYMMTDEDTGAVASSD